VATKQEGLAPKNLRRCMLRARRGGERFQRTPGSPPRSLKKQYQATGVAAWLRDGPLVFANDELLFVPVLGIDARWRAAPGSRMLGLRWVANDSPATPVLDPLLD
jgi:tRNA(Ile)-lysidine synthase